MIDDVIPDRAERAAAGRRGGAPGMRFAARLMQSPYRGTVYLTELASAPALQPEEYRWGTDLDVRSGAPILLSWSQHYRLLADLVRLARLHIAPAPLMLVRHLAPNHIVPLPAELLAPDVILTDDPDFLASLMRDRSTVGVLAIEDDFRRDGYETGNNEWSISLYNGCDERVFLDYLRATPLAVCGIDIAVDGIQVLP